MVCWFGFGWVCCLATPRVAVVLRIVAKVLGVLGLVLSLRLLFDFVSVEFGVASVFPAVFFFVILLLLVASVLALLS